MKRAPPSSKLRQALISNCTKWLTVQCIKTSLTAFMLKWITNHQETEVRFNFFPGAEVKVLFISEGIQLTPPYIVRL